TLKNSHGRSVCSVPKSDMNRMRKNRKPYVTEAVDIFAEIVNYSCSLHGSAEEDRLHHRFDFASHLLSGNTTRSLVPLSRGAEDGPGGCGCKQFWIGTGCRLVMLSAFHEHVLHGRNDGIFYRHLRQL